jgi:hypothetical protein
VPESTQAPEAGASSKAQAETPREEAKEDPPEEGISPTLLQKSDLHYVGAFRVPLDPPAGQKWASNFAYGGTALAFNPKGNSLFLVGHDHQQLVAEVSIPKPVRSKSMKELPVAKMLQPFADITEGMKKENKIGGLLVDGDQLLWTTFMYYDASWEAKQSHGISTCNLAKPNAQGLFALKDISVGAVAGFMCHVPPDWKDKFGVPLLTGQAGIPIVSRTSSGPVAVGFDPKDLGKQSAPTTVFLYYPLEHPLAPLESKNTLWNHCGKVAGMAFVSRQGKSSVMFFGTRGLGEYWYGGGEFQGKKDPFDESKGTHAPPYAETIWFYDPNDLLLVKKKEKNPWEIKPYQVVDLPGVKPSGHGRLGGVAYDESTGRLYVSQKNVDNVTNHFEWLPIIHVYEVGKH